MINVSEIYKDYGKKKVLKGAGFTADAGTCVGIIGANGSGKTTLLSILAGALKPDSGSVRYDGNEALGHRAVFEKYAAYVPQENPLMEELTVKDNLLLWYKGNKESIYKDIESGAAGRLGIGDMLTMTAGKLSGGMKKRLSIACSLSGNAKVLILDEPGAALDLIGKEEIKKYLIEYKNSGGTVVLCSHEMLELTICEKMYILKGGILKEIPTGLPSDELIIMLESKQGGKE